MNTNKQTKGIIGIPRPPFPKLPEILRRTQQNSIKVGDVNISFQRTVRVPQGKVNGLPAGLGNFPIYKVSDFRSGCPNEWKNDAYFFPMHPQEAMWMSFSGNYANPQALIIAAGNINAITGKPFDKSKDTKNPCRCPDGLDIRMEDKQNYVVVPTQPWLDGWKAEDDKIYQFVAAELGSGETVEGQITGEESIGGIQFITYSAKDSERLRIAKRPQLHYPGMLEGLEAYACAIPKGAKRCMASPQSMGLGRGGEIKQKIYPDPYGLSVWQAENAGTGLIHLVSSEDFKQITGHNAPATPVTYEKYQELGIPWFGLYDGHYADTGGSDVFSKLDPVKGGKKSEKPFEIFE